MMPNLTYKVAILGVSQNVCAGIVDIDLKEILSQIFVIKPTRGCGGEGSHVKKNDPSQSHSRK